MNLIPLGQEPAFPLSPPPPPCIHSLAPELIKLIFEKGVEDLLERWKRKEREKFLLAVSSVCSSWTEAAQSVLWSDILVLTDDRAKRVLASPVFGKFITRNLVLMGGAGGVNPKDVTSIICGLRRLRSMKLSNFEEEGEWLEAETLCLESLKDLKSLSLFETVVSQSSSGLSPSLAPRHLTIDYGYRHPLATPLFSYFKNSASQLETLCILPCLFPLDVDPVSFIITSASSTLRSLEISSALPGPLLESVTKCEILRELSFFGTGDHFLEVAAALHAQGLQYFRICPMNLTGSSEMTVAQGVLVALSRGYFSKIERLIINMDDGNFDEMDGSLELRSQLDRAGVELQIL